MAAHIKDAFHPLPRLVDIFTVELEDPIRDLDFSDTVRGIDLNSETFTSNRQPWRLSGRNSQVIIESSEILTAR